MTCLRLCHLFVLTRTFVGLIQTLAGECQLLLEPLDFVVISSREFPCILGGRIDSVHLEPKGFLGSVKFALGSVKFALGSVTFALGIVKFALGIVKFALGIVKFVLGLLQTRVDACRLVLELFDLFLMSQRGFERGYAEFLCLIGELRGSLHFELKVCLGGIKFVLCATL